MKSKQEAHVRRLASRQGLALRKSRRRDPSAADFGALWLIDPASNVLVFGDPERGPESGGVSLADIEAYLRK